MAVGVYVDFVYVVPVVAYIYPDAHLPPMETTTIRLSVDTARRLRERAAYEDSMDAVVRRLLDAAPRRR